MTIIDVGFSPESQHNTTAREFGAFRRDDGGGFPSKHGCVFDEGHHQHHFFSGVLQLFFTGNSFLIIACFLSIWVLDERKLLLACEDHYESIRTE